MSVRYCEYRGFQIRSGAFEVLPGRRFVSVTCVIQRLDDALHEHLIEGGVDSVQDFFGSEEDALCHSRKLGRAWVDRKWPILQWLERFRPGGPGGRGETMQ